MSTRLAPLNVLAALRLESSRTWQEVAAPFQRQDAAAFFDPFGPRWHYVTRPRGGSKTTDAAGVALAWLAAEAPAGARGYVFATSADQAGLLVDAASGLVDRTSALRGSIGVETWKLIGRSGASVEVLSADGASAFGLRPALVIVDEFALWSNSRNMRRLWTAVVSAMGKVPGSRLLVITAAGEPASLAHRVLLEARRSDRWRVSETPGPLPWVPAEELEAQRPLLRDSEFARLHENVWCESEDRLVSAEDLEAACVLDGPQEPQPGVRYVVTADLGVKHDRTVVVVAHAEAMGEGAGAPRRVIVDRLLRWQGSRLKHVQLGEVEAAIELACREYHGAQLHCDPWQAIGLLQRLRAKGVKASEFTFSAQSVGRVANALHLALRNRTLLLPGDEDLRSELSRVRLSESTPGSVRLDHDSGEHDDMAVAIAIACAVLQGKSEPGAMWLKVWDKEIASRSAHSGLTAAQREQLRRLPVQSIAPGSDRPLAGARCTVGEPHHRFQRVRGQGWQCAVCGCWQAPQ